MYSVPDKRRSRKVIAFFATAAVIIVSLVVAIIAVSTNKTSEVSIAGEEDNTSFTISEDAGDTENIKETTKEEPGAADVVVSTDVKELPTTGPVDLLAVALALGGLTTLATAIIMSKIEA